MIIFADDVIEIGTDFLYFNKIVVEKGFSKSYLLKLTLVI